MAYTRPHEDRLGSDGGTDKLLSWTGTGVAAYVDRPAGFTPVVGYAESNTPPASHATPGTLTPVTWDAFYDLDQDPVALPAGLGLSEAGGTFTALEGGVWTLNLAIIPADTGNAGRVLLSTPTYDYAPILGILASGNPSQLMASFVLPMKVGQSFSVVQDSTGISSAQVSYAALDIVRLAGAVS